MTLAPLGRRLLVLAAHVLSIPVYCAYELFVRVINGRAAPLSADMVSVVEPYFTDLVLGKVRLRAPAVVPSGHAGLTLGSRIFSARQLEADSVDDMALLIHELVHVRQRMTFGRFAMMRRYGVEWARQLSYRNHAMEIEARQVQMLAREALMANRIESVDDRE